MPDYAVFFTVLDKSNEGQYLQQHIDYFNQLRTQGHVIANGKLEDGSGGLAIFRAPSEDDVQSLLQKDPFVALQIRKVEVKQWNAKWADTVIPPSSVIKEISASELKARMERGDRPFIVDVREDDEVAQGIIPGSYHIRLGDLPERYAELPKEKELLFVCRGGRRSMAACELLQEKKYTQLVNITGGITAWNES